MSEFHREERLLTIENLGLQYGDKTILRDVTLHIDNIVRPGINQGQVVALLGLSGCGKTQLFRCIAGLQRPTSGSVLLNTSKHTVLPGEVGVVQQAYPLMNHRTVWGNLMLACDLHGAKDGPARAADLLKHFGLADKKNSYSTELSGGQRQRVAIIQQLLCSNYFLLMDEPFSGLDLVAKGRVIDTIQTVSTANSLSTVIFTTHDLQAAVTLADEIWILGPLPGLPGSTIIKQIDLAELGLAWAPDIEHHPLFWPTVLEIKALLRSMS